MSLLPQGRSLLLSILHGGSHPAKSIVRVGVLRIIFRDGLGQSKSLMIYKVDRLTRFVADFAEFVEQFEGRV